ncbi:50S ribosomal protein L7ae [Bacillus cereus group sp. N6]|uniref:50S ribosomal protein L7ae n=1 Tax=Bacillus cereus group sp. N6 TaxID=2794583 RepID=UPI0018F3D446|nr:50S ribosomal protein L7ae [Bacillus cereus group sp. N6]MBJ8113822.1 50S ribosomal protein L7ae [Bacillus cereus group sp. N6]
MAVNSYYTYITIKELIFIHAYVTGEEIPSSQALQILKQFAPEAIPGTIRQTRRYRIRENGEELFGYYRQKHPKLFDKQKLYTHEKLKHRAVYYCSSHLTVHI